MMFSDKAILMREIGNGIMFLSAMCTVFIFAWYIWDYHKELGWRDRTIIAATSICVLMTGHAVRAGPSWMEFLWADLGWDPHVWTSRLEFFFTATVLTILGKLWVDFTFSKYNYRWPIFAFISIFSIGLPIGLHFFMEWLYS